MNECLYPDENGELCHNKVIVEITKIHENKPNLTMELCIEHLNEITRDNLKIKELD